MTLEDVIDLREACTLSGYSMRRMYDYVKGGVIVARQTPSGTWFTTRAEALRLKERGRMRRGRPRKQSTP